MKTNNKKNFFYFAFLIEDDRPGYKEKVHGQAKAISQKYTTILFTRSKKGIYIYTYENRELIGKEEKVLNKRRLKKERNVVDETLALIKFCKYINVEIRKFDGSYVYIRRNVPNTPIIINFIKKLKRQRNYIIYEYPTYPWDEEYMPIKEKRFKIKLFYLSEKLTDKYLQKYVDLFTYIGEYNGIDERYIRIQNGGDSSNYPLHNKVNKNNNEVNLIGVAFVKYVTGYDLVIDALYQYYNSKNHDRKVTFTIVGSIDVGLDLKRKVEELNLSEYVFFSGEKSGEELNQLINNADIGVNVLRIKNILIDSTAATTLKTIEYTYRGLPQIAQLPLMVDCGNADVPSFVYIYNGQIDIQEVVDFYDNLEVTSREIREYAEKHMSWDRIMDVIIKEVGKKEAYYE